ncbi:hypothetical protein IMG5_018600, partial [Ichthyophthirius multifiliis]
MFYTRSISPMPIMNNRPIFNNQFNHLQRHRSQYQNSNSTDNLRKSENRLSNSIVFKQNNSRVLSQNSLNYSLNIRNSDYYVHQKYLNNKSLNSYNQNLKIPNTFLQQVPQNFALNNQKLNQAIERSEKIIYDINQ